MKREVVTEFNISQSTYGQILGHFDIGARIYSDTVEAQLPEATTQANSALSKILDDGNIP
jgi:hypothetical protein